MRSHISIVTLHISFWLYLNVPVFCLVLKCANNQGKRKDLSLCRVPKVVNRQGEEMEILSILKRWLPAISRHDLSEILKNQTVFVESISTLEKLKLCGIPLTLTACLFLILDITKEAKMKRRSSKMRSEPADCKQKKA